MQISALNETVMDALVRQDRGVLEGLALSTLQDSLDSSLTSESADATASLLRNFDWDTLAEIYVDQTTGPAAETVSVTGFQILVPDTGRETYMVVLRVKGGWRDPAVGLVYVRVKDQWRIRNLHIGGLIALGGRTASDWHREARRLMDQDKTLSASRCFDAAWRCLRPTPIMRSDLEDELTQLAGQVEARLLNTVTLPVRLDRMEGTPTIHGFDTAFDDGQAAPVVIYVTSLRLTDAAGLKREAELIQEQMQSWFPDLCENATVTVYRAYRVAPLDANESYEYYGTVQDCGCPPPS